VITCYTLSTALPLISLKSQILESAEDADSKGEAATAQKMLALDGEKAEAWNVHPFQLVSLLDMLQVYAAHYLEIGKVLGMIDTLVKGTWFPHAPLTDQDCVTIMAHLHVIKDSCAQVHLKPSESICDLLLQRYSQTKPSRNDLKNDFELLAGSVTGGLGERLFLYIPPNDAAFLVQPAPLFGIEVANNFPSTKDDIREAGRCFALERHTACVFHCMRVLEKGLHALVHDLNNRFAAGIHFSKTIEATNWGNILDEIHHTLTKQNRLQRLNPQPTKDDMQFYASAAKEFEYFKEAWRDDVSHSRGTYDRPDAARVMQHVDVFMRHLALRLKE
jgi:hypothetical protein